MSWLPARVDWQRCLPPGLLYFVEHTLKRSLADLREVKVEAQDDFPYATEMALQGLKRIGIQRYRLSAYTLYFVDGQVTQLVPHTDVWEPPLIERYNDVLHPCEWIHRFILEAPAGDPAPDYTDPNEAFRVLARLVRRAESDALLVAFAGLLQAADHLESHELVPVLRMMCLAPPWTPQQICTAAYHAYLNIRKDAN